MSSQHPPLTCEQVKQLLKNLNFKERPKRAGTSHQDWVADKFRGKFRKVTIDCPKAPFSQDLIKWMALQAGVTKKEFYAARDPQEANKILGKK